MSLRRGSRLSSEKSRRTYKSLLDCERDHFCSFVIHFATPLPDRYGGLTSSSGGRVCILVWMASHTLSTAGVAVSLKRSLSVMINKWMDGPGSAVSIFRAQPFIRENEKNERWRERRKETMIKWGRKHWWDGRLKDKGTTVAVRFFYSSEVLLETTTKSNTSIV